MIYKRTFTKGAVISSGGCPYNCSYFNLKQIYCEPIRTRPIEEVITEINTIKSKFFVFWDDNFFGDTNYTKKLLVELKKCNKRWAAQVTLERCKDEELLLLAKKAGCVYFFVGIDGATVSILTPLPKTPIYSQFKKENRLITEDWSYYNGKTKVAYIPKNMSREELFEGYMWFRREFYSLRSIFKRIRKSKTNIIYNLIVNLGYKISLKVTEI